MNSIIINGVVVASGNNISVQNGKIVVDDKDVTPDTKQISIAITGNIEKLDVDVCNKITVTGDVGSILTSNGDVEVGGNISGSVETTNGDVDCKGSIGGKVSTVNGDIKHRK